MWGHPYLSALAIVLIVAAFVVMVNAPDHRQEVVLTLAAIGRIMQKRHAG